MAGTNDLAYQERISVLECEVETLQGERDVLAEQYKQAMNGLMQRDARIRDLERQLHDANVRPLRTTSRGTSPLALVGEAFSNAIDKLGRIRGRSSREASPLVGAQPGALETLPKGIALGPAGPPDLPTVARPPSAQQPKEDDTTYKQWVVKASGVFHATNPTSTRICTFYECMLPGHTFHYCPVRFGDMTSPACGFRSDAFGAKNSPYQLAQRNNKSLHDMITEGPNIGGKAFSSARWKALVQLHDRASSNSGTRSEYVRDVVIYNKYPHMPAF